MQLLAEELAGLRVQLPDGVKVPELLVVKETVPVGLVGVEPRDIRPLPSQRQPVVVVSRVLVHRQQDLPLVRGAGDLARGR